MNGSFLLDTNVVIRLLRGDVDIRDRIAQQSRILVPVIAIGEVYFGAMKAARAGDNLRRINRFLTQVAVLECNAASAYEYGLIRHELRIAGRPIPENDIWIAAAARQHDLTLVSRDSHFA
ncbi:MAG: type II toxin-antitoxin system VapC family toxin, partial [Thermoguttaceae bacterium]